ncbi:7377_t:CDS:2 [Diversispora eburnea]|uniref:7377_t:CDS:1 n=1 Tax=Diversispora eburnea TaxID=1213867 RepID=A0A9N9BJM8_9GLOM|nr:7377_t:CDS:2 [Diversispora eburnea]
MVTKCISKTNDAMAEMKSSIDITANCVVIVVIFSLLEKGAPRDVLMHPFLPNFCGMTMRRANEMIQQIQIARSISSASSRSNSSRELNVGTEEIRNQYGQTPVITLLQSQGMTPAQQKQMASSSNPVVPSDSSFIKHTRDDEDKIFDAILEDEILYPVNISRVSVSILQKFSPTDTLNFNEEFTKERPPVNSHLNTDNQDEFRGFSYVSD